MDRQRNRAAVGAIAAVAGWTCVGLQGADVDFAAAVTSTRPIAYYRLESTEGKSEVGATQYKPSGGVTSVGPGGPVGVANNYFVKLNGIDGYVVTTQAGGVGAAASMMAWVNLDTLPSQENRFFYVEGESQSGNDLDLQFENDNQLKFYTAAGGHVTYAPAPATLVNEWHMIVATVDTASQTRVIYWDGKPAATDKGGGRAGKTGIFSIGASTVFGGRFFKGGIDEVALWDRALTGAEVATMYAAAKASSAVTAAPGAAPVGVSATTGQFPTTAKVEVDDSNGPLKLKREEQIAILFLTAIQSIESDCQNRANRACTMAELAAGPVAANGARIDHLKFDPKTDPRYHGFHRIVTNTRSRNARMIALNQEFGFRIVRTTPGYYSDPKDATVVMELQLGETRRAGR
ncbi:MAG TPA: LamG domain-containing protein [Bryobacteraceae bacterium]|nr:LamG domain-containing protein [Bryobacteraceae bacterium]